MHACLIDVEQQINLAVWMEVLYWAFKMVLKIVLKFVLKWINPWMDAWKDKWIKRCIIILPRSNLFLGGRIHFLEVESMKNFGGDSNSRLDLGPIRHSISI